jgi:hypothetical protein
MQFATIQALETAFSHGNIDSWLAQFPNNLRAKLQRALELDRHLCSHYPASLASCLLIRTFAIEELANYRTAWMDELNLRHQPWIRPLRVKPMPQGLFAELHSNKSLNFNELHQVSFADQNVILVSARPRNAGLEERNPRRRDRLRWNWFRAEAQLEPDPDADADNDQPSSFPQFASQGWGPCSLVRGPGEEPIPLPCPEDGSATGCLSMNGKRLLVYGSEDEYGGGFVYVIDSLTLEIEHVIATSQPVSKVLECEDSDILLLKTYGGLVLWKQGKTHSLAIPDSEAFLSPDGRYLVTTNDVLRIWVVEELELGNEQPKPGFPTRFSPSGHRLVSGTQLYDGLSGHPIANVDPQLGGFLEGGPASPWFHGGEQFLLSNLGLPNRWSMKTGAPLPSENHKFFPHWYMLAYDREGIYMAVMRIESSEGKLYLFSTMEVCDTFRFSLEATALALSHDGQCYAARGDETVEVRHKSGELLGKFTHKPETMERMRSSSHSTDSLFFSNDGRRIASYHQEDGWRIWSLVSDHEEHLPATKTEILKSLPKDFGQSGPDDWTMETEIQPVFTYFPKPYDWRFKITPPTVCTHQSSGTQIALPANGPWVYCAQNPHIVACDDMHLELCSGTEG